MLRRIRIFSSVQSILPCFVVSVAAIHAAATAIVIRHDIPDAAYLGKESDYPALFGIYRTKAGHKECVATVIARSWAVTAAHCAREKKLIDAVRAGGSGYSVQVAGRAAVIDLVVPHPRRGNGRPPDIALLHFAFPVDHVAPLPLYRNSDEQGRVVAMPGWGGTGNGKSGLAAEDGLFRVAENLVDRAEEGRLWWKFDAPGPNSRALTLEGISGPGDSGGPALIKTPSGWAVAGISSAQDTMGGPEGLYAVEEVFVRVSEVASWIDEQVGRRGQRKR
jgi:hypothetical protein